jgi:hypothetical protein
MTDQTATHDGDQLKIEQAADIAAMPARQIGAWMKAHKLEAHRGCTGFQIEELGLSEFRPALRCMPRP